VSRMVPLLVELGVEEIPSAYLPGLIDELRRRATTAFAGARLAVADLSVDGTPRRLALTGLVAERQTPAVRRVRGPALKSGLDANGQPTPAAKGFAARVGVPVDALQPGDGPDAAYLTAVVESPVRAAQDVLPEILPDLLEGMDVPRSMRWTAADVRFVRPVRWLVALLGDTVLPVEAFLVPAGRRTYGNRTDHPEPLDIADAAHYESVLDTGRVMLSRARRRAEIWRRGQELAAGEGGRLAENEALLDEVADLVEWPVPFLGRFNPAFLRVPAPILVTSMVHHQRYFPVWAAAGDTLLPVFVGVRNGRGLDLSHVIHGNERVLEARLNDAAFFYEEDRKVRLVDLLPALDGMVYHERLGSYGRKVERVVRLARETAAELGLGPDEASDLARAAELSKADLLTHVVGEFPELEGVVGGLYALEQGEPAAVAEAIRDQYRPRFGGDHLPATRVGQALALLDRLDSLAGAVATGLEPTGSEDPFGFRRMALGVARILMAGDLAGVLLADLARRALAPFDAAGPEQVTRLVQFVEARARAWLGETYRADLVDAALAAPTPWDSLPDRLRRLAEWSGQAEFADVMTAFKRVMNLAGGHPPAEAVAYPEGPEAHLADALRWAEATADTWDRYWEAARALREPVDRFFTDVLVMDPDPAVRARRLGLLARVGRFLSRGADLTRVTGERRG
jgi:glycyl-tRNA synthetase beta chain